MIARHNAHVQRDGCSCLVAHPVAKIDVQRILFVRLSEFGRSDRGLRGTRWTGAYEKGNFGEGGIGVQGCAAEPVLAKEDQSHQDLKSTISQRPEARRVLGQAGCAGHVGEGRLYRHIVIRRVPGASNSLLGLAETTRTVKRAMVEPRAMGSPMDTTAPAYVAPWCTFAVPVSTFPPSACVKARETVAAALPRPPVAAKGRTAFPNRSRGMRRMFTSSPAPQQYKCLSLLSTRRDELVAHPPLRERGVTADGADM
eukprot:scaffold130311_cov32-Tisochrysis_lutea.AAC.2